MDRYSLLVSALLGLLIGVAVPLLVERPSLSGSRVARTGQVVQAGSVATPVPSPPVLSNRPAGSPRTATPGPGLAQPDVAPTLPSEPGPAARETPAPIATTASTVGMPGAEQMPRAVAATTVPPPPTEAPEAPATRTSSPPAVLDPRHVGIDVRSPPDGARVPSNVVVTGGQARPAPPGLHVWAFVKADVPDSRWYAWHRGEVVAGPDNTWAIDPFLGGPPGTRHELRLGTVDDAVHAELQTFLQRNPDQPLPHLPAGFVPEARITVTVE